jgi:hypothetical protein
MRLRKPAALGLYFVLCAFGQSTRGTITGTVSDSAGAVVPSAPIEATNSDTGVKYQAATSATGNYTLPELPVGTYAISVTVPGFKQSVRTGLAVEAAQVMRIDFTLEIGQSSESVTVEAETPLLRTETGDVSHVVQEEMVINLPIVQGGPDQGGGVGIRNPYNEAEMVPGVFYIPDVELKLNGAPGNSEALRIDGQVATNSVTVSTPQQSQPSLEAMQEFTIQTSNYAPEYGQAGGGIIIMTTKSGTNQYHGSAYDYFVNEIFNAGDPFSDAPAGTGNPRPRARRNDYGFSFGGPVRIPKLYNGRDRTFFFFNFEQYRETEVTTTQQETVPTLAYRSGNFATAMIGKAIGTDPLGRPIYQGEIYDPATTTLVNGQSVRNPFPNNTIPASRFDPVAAKIQSLFPMPVGPNAGAVVNNYEPPVYNVGVDSIPSVKIDQFMGSKGKLSAFYSANRFAHPLDNVHGNADGLPDPITSNVGVYIPTNLVRLNYDYTLSPTLLMHFGAGFQWVDFGVVSVTANGSQYTNYNAMQQLGLDGAIVNTFFPPISGLCVAGASVRSCAGQGGMISIGSSSHSESYQERPAFNTSLTWVRTNHTFKVGAEFLTEGYPALSYTNTAGNYVFSYAQTSLPYLNGNTLQGVTPGFGYASFLLGDVNQVTIANPTDSRLGKKQLGVYIQDSWKAKKTLTVDYGLRYDYSTYLQEEYGRDPVFSPTTSNPAVGGIPGAVTFDGYGPGHCNCNIAKNYPYGVAPRLGVAYQFAPKMVLRGGFGIVYDETEAGNGAAAALAGSSNTVAAPSFGLPVTTLSTGIPASFDPAPWPNFAPGQFNPTKTPVALSAPWIDPNAGRPPRQYQWSVGVQREFLHDFVADVYYMGSRGIWWYAPGLMNLNAINPATLAARGLNINSPTVQQLLTSTLNSPLAAAMGFNTPPYPGFPLTQTVAQSLRPFPQYTTINSYWDPLGDTWYNALQAKATKRFSHGLSVLSTFTWSKNEDLGVETNTPAASGGAVINNVFNRANNKYLSAFDQPFQSDTSLTYVTPSLRANKVLSWITRDWTYGAFLRYASGLPIEVPLANNNLSNMLFQPTFADVVPGQSFYTVNLNCHCYDPQKTFVLNPAAWTNPAVGQFGTSAAYYNNYRAQRRPVENMSLGRTWRFKERAAFNLRMEFGNIFNRAFYNDPSSTNAQATQTYLPNGNTASGFGYINATTKNLSANAPVSLSPRYGTLVGRFTF